MAWPPLFLSSPDPALQGLLTVVSAGPALVHTHSESALHLCPLNGHPDKLGADANILWRDDPGLRDRTSSSPHGWFGVSINLKHAICFFFHSDCIWQLVCTKMQVSDSTRTCFMISPWTDTSTIITVSRIISFNRIKVKG